MARARAVSGRRPAVSGRRPAANGRRTARSVAGAPRSAAGARAVSGPRTGGQWPDQLCARRVGPSVVPSIFVPQHFSS